MTRSASGTETITTTTKPAVTMSILRIVVNGTTNVKFYVDGVLVATHTTGLPLGTTRLGWHLGNVITATTARTLITDYVRVWSDDPADNEIVFDQAASDNIDPEVFKIEKEAFAYADGIITVSEFTKRIIVE